MRPATASGLPTDAADATILRIAEAIVRLVDPHRIVLFGSNARGEAGPGSDVDLLVVTDLTQPRTTLACAIRRELRGMGVPKDIVVISPEEAVLYRDVPGTVIGPALREGRVVYERRPVAP
ncbi:MAG: nucleotidyltransferase domain-containing protein [Armatimonadetes bacterium]|nr:nucleotidyltransferase domain-containing protein [Armatimonadota bacterium]